MTKHEVVGPFCAWPKSVFGPGFRYVPSHANRNTVAERLLAWQAAQKPCIEIVQLRARQA